MTSKLTGSVFDRKCEMISGKITFDAFSEAMKFSSDELKEKADRKMSQQNQRSSRFKGFF